MPKLFRQAEAVEDELAQLTVQRQELVHQHNLLKVPPPALPGRQEVKTDLDKRTNLLRGVEQKRNTLDVRVGQLKDTRDHQNNIEAQNLFFAAWSALLSEIETLRTATSARFIEQFSASMRPFFAGLGEEEFLAVGQVWFSQTTTSAQLGELESSIFAGSGYLPACRALVARFGELAALKKN